MRNIHCPWVKLEHANLEPTEKQWNDYQRVMHDLGREPKELHGISRREMQFVLSSLFRERDRNELKSAQTKRSEKRHDATT